MELWQLEEERRLIEPAPIPVEFINHPLYSDSNMLKYWSLNDTKASLPTGHTLTSAAWVFADGYWGRCGYHQPGYLYSSATLTLGSAWTVSVWINPTVPIPATSPYYNHMAIMAGASDTQFLGIRDYGAYMYTTQIHAYRFDLNVGWHNVVWKYDGTDLMANVDGSTFSSVTMSNPLKSAASIVVFGERFSYSGAHIYRGYLDDVVLFNRCLSDAEAISIFTGV